MPLSRREFLKLSGMTAAGAFLGGTAFLSGCKTYDKLSGTKESTTICPYCGVGCGLIVSTRNGRIVNTEGDPDHPINRGALCAKGSALFQVAINERRLAKVQYRRPYGTEWEEISWDEAVKKIARRVKDTRDATFQEKDGAVTVNRTNGIASLGGAALDNEECYVLSKFMRTLGVTYLEHQARLCHSSTVAGLAASFGRGIMTNHWIDIKNADVILIMGSNAAENHPASFRWVLKAMEERGAKLIVVDPRVTRSASMASLYAPLRPGTDLAFLGGMINYALEKNRIQREYVLEYTNASYLVNPDYSFNDGLFSGYDAAKRSYGDRTTWTYQVDSKNIPRRDKTLKDPRCVYQLMKAHYSRYTPEKVEAITGCPKETFLKVAELFTSTHKPDRVATIMYAMGTTQHTVGTQNIRAYAILQLLMGNIGLAGGGINAMRGESNVQGSTDHGLLFHILTGYNPCPDVKNHSNLEEYIDKTTPKNTDPMSINWWSNRSKYLISMLKAWYGDAATKKNDFCFDWLPKYGKPVPHIVLFEDMFKGLIKGAFLMGTNPTVGGPNANRGAQSLEKLDWMVAVDLWETESSTFWKRPGANPAQIKTEVFLLPGAASVEKEGSISNSGRWVQWRYKAANPPGKAKSDLDILDLLFREIRDLYKKEGGRFPDPILKSNWNYVPEGEHEASPHLVAKEINGYTWPDRKQMKSFMDLKDDGTTACGNWVYCGSYPGSGKNLMARRGTKDAPNKIGTYPEWSWCWPLNRRIAYNRAAVDRTGKPWDAERWVVKWTGSKWKGDVVDGGPKFGPAEKNPFIMNNEGVGRLFAPGKAVTDGPFSEHYEPMESPIMNLMNSQKVNPASAILDSVAGQFAATGQYPCIATTYRMVEHWQAGAMTRNLPWLNELVPDMFCEISPSLAAARGIKHGEKVTIFNSRGRITAYALVTERIKPMKINGRMIEMIGMIWHFGPGARASGDAANQLTPSIGDGNTMIPEYKAFLADIRKEA